MYNVTTCKAFVWIHQLKYLCFSEAIWLKREKTVFALFHWIWSRQHRWIRFVSDFLSFCTSWSRRKRLRRWNVGKTSLSSPFFKTWFFQIPCLNYLVSRRALLRLFLSSLRSKDTKTWKLLTGGIFTQLRRFFSQIHPSKETMDTKILDESFCHRLNSFASTNCLMINYNMKIF